MNTIRGTWVEGQIVLDDKTDWPDGTRVEVSLSELDREGLGLREEDRPDTPENRAELLRRMDEFEPMEMTPGDEADWHAWCQKVKEYTIAKMYRDTDGLFP